VLFTLTCTEMKIVVAYLSRANDSSAQFTHSYKMQKNLKIISYPMFKLDGFYSFSQEYWAQRTSYIGELLWSLKRLLRIHNVFYSQQMVCKLKFVSFLLTRGCFNRKAWASCRIKYLFSLKKTFAPQLTNAAAALEKILRTLIIIFQRALTFFARLASSYGQLSTNLYLF